VIGQEKGRLNALKKMAVHVVTMLFCGSLILSACSKEQATTAPTSDKKESPTASNVNPPGQFPVVKDKITLKVAVKGSSLVEDLKTNGYTKWLENKTNVHVDWTILDEKGYQEQLNLLLAGGNLPDVLMNLDVSPEQQMIYGEQGLFVSFTDLIEKYGENTKKIFKEMPEAKSAVTAPGN
jgi:putative aldouronate transport system substrate-binding protein